MTASSRINHLPLALNSDRSPTLVQSLRLHSQVCAFFCSPFHILFSLGVVGLSRMCAEYNLVFETHAGVLVTLTLFPITFSLGNMLEIRRALLDSVTTVKGNIHVLYLTLERIRRKSDYDSQSFICSDGALAHLHSVCHQCKDYAATLTEDCHIELDQSIRGEFYGIHGFVDTLCTHTDPFTSQRLTTSCLALFQSYECFKGRVDYKASMLMRQYLSYMTYINMILLTPWFASILQKVQVVSLFAYLLILSVTASFMGLLTILNELDNVFGHDWDDLNIDALFSPLQTTEPVSVQYGTM